MRRQLRVLLVLVSILFALCVTVAGGQADGPPIVINELLVGNAATNLDPDYTNYSSWVELRNNGASAVSLSGLRLVSLREGHPPPQSYTLPNVSIPAGGHVLVWYDELTVGGLHVPYELDMDGGWIELRTAGGDVIDSVTLGEQRPDVSYGRNGGGWAFFDPPTPGAANTTPSFASLTGTVAAAPVFSVPGGRYNGARAVALSTTEPGGVIRYTLDGSRPTAASPVYSGPITINTVKVLRARTFADGRISSAAVSETYLIDVPAHLPAVSIATDPAHMFDNYIGIFVEGKNGIAGCGKKANWHQPWERPASVEMYDTSGARLFGQQAGIEIHGNCTRNLKMKSFELKARKEYGDNEFSYPLFDDRPMQSYRRLVLRTGGQDTANTLLRDALGSHMLSGQMDIERGAWRPVVVYINGEFWGVYNLREKMDEDLIENLYGLDEETDFDAIQERGIVLAGNVTRWNAFYTYITTHDPANPAVYAYLQTQMDMINYIDYQIAEIYAANTDWPQNNIRFWRGYAPDSKWRWILHDLDKGFSNDTGNGAGHNTLKQAMAKKGTKAYHGLILSQLSRNPDFRALFAQRFAAYLNTTFAPQRMTAVFNGMAGNIAPDMPAQVARWKMPKGIAGWNTQLNKVRTFIQKRPAAVIGHIDLYLNKPGTVTLTTVAGADGDILVAGVPVPDNYSGPHFRNTPVTLTAVPAPGQEFSHWAETGATTATITVTLNGPATYTAVFGELPPPPPVPDIVINEILYRPLPESDEPDKEFIELYHAGATTADLSGYTIDAISYTFPAGALVDPGEYIVVAANSADPAYAGLDADDVFDWAWGDDNGHKLSNSSEPVTLRHADGREVDSVTYNDDAPWPTEPDGDGPSLALLDVSYDNSLPASWAASREPGGTPGAENFPPLPPVPALVINEIHYNPDDANQGPDATHEFIELVNTSAEPVALEGYVLTGVEFIFPAGASIAANEHIVIAADAASHSGSYQVFQWTAGELADDGETVALTDPFAQPVDEVSYGDSGDWPALPDGNGPTLSLGDPALDNSAAANWAASDFAGGTPGAANWPVVPLVVTEVHYNVNETLQPGGDAVWEFLEVYNAGDRAIDLSGYTTTGVTATFPAGASIAAGETIVVANDATTYATAGCTVYDWASGGLSSDGETITFKNRFGVAVMAFAYGTAAPWPTEPDGDGPSLALLDVSYDNSLPESWAASREPGGTPCAENFPPLPPVPDVIINEILYHPATAGNDEFIELVNAGNAAAALEGYVLTGVDFTFPAGASISAGEHIVIAADAASHSGSYQVFQWTAGELADDGETVTLTDNNGQEVDTVTYGDSGDWPVLPDGNGPTLSLGDPALDNSAAANWAASDFAGGTPGAANWPAVPLVVTEVHYNVNETLQPGGDDVWEFLEVYNAGSQSIDLSGYTTDGIVYTFPAGASIAAGETIVVANDATTYATAGCTVYDWTNGGLSGGGETIKFKNRFDVTVMAFTYADVAPWPTEPDGDGPSLALLDVVYDNSLPASWDASRETGGTPCAANFPPLPPVPALVINEIHYNPDDANQGPDATYEFIEVVNTGSEAVALEGYTLAGIEFTFPAGASIGAGEHIVIAADAASHSGGGYQVFQWTAGELADDGETVTLTDTYARVVDEVSYSDTGDWPAAPDGSGPSLSLSDPALENSAAANWAASNETGGTPGAANGL